MYTCHPHRGHNENQPNRYQHNTTQALVYPAQNQWLCSAFLSCSLFNAHLLLSLRTDYLKCGWFFPLFTFRELVKCEIVHYFFHIWDLVYYFSSWECVFISLGNIVDVTNSNWIHWIISMKNLLWNSWNSCNYIIPATPQRYFVNYSDETIN